MYETINKEATNFDKPIINENTTVHELGLIFSSIIDQLKDKTFTIEMFDFVHRERILSSSMSTLLNNALEIKKINKALSNVSSELTIGTGMELSLIVHDNYVMSVSAAIREDKDGILGHSIADLRRTFIVVGANDILFGFPCLKHTPIRNLPRYFENEKIKQNMRFRALLIQEKRRSIDSILKGGNVQ